VTQIPESLLNRIKACRTLPSVPAVAVKVLELCEQEEVAIAQIAAVLSRDPALAAKVLKVANSAFYGVRSQVTTLERAVSIMGINATLSLSLSFSLTASLRKTGTRGFNHAMYWRRSVITAASARLLAAQRDRPADEYFLAGLMQDIGMLVLNVTLPDDYGQVVSSAAGDHEKLAELERKAFGADHSSVGSWLAQKWNLPENLRTSIEASHNPEDFKACDPGDVTKVATLAGFIAEIWCNPQTLAATAAAREKATELLRMSTSAFEQLLKDVAASLPGITANLEMDIGGEDTIKSLLDEAREALIVLNLQAQQRVCLMQDLAKQDRLTSLYNRCGLEDLLPQYFEAAMRMKAPLSVIFLDVDDFKHINDTYGHKAGDAVLMSVARILRSATRSSDMVARYGGDEFVCLLPNTAAESAHSAAERIRESVASPLHETSTGDKVNVTVSLGCATFSEQNTFQDAGSLLQKADSCLYTAKRLGRNRVASPSSSEVDLQFDRDSTGPSAFIQ
jgi:diguanylate cyclase (GGDEF)-like protein